MRWTKSRSASSPISRTAIIGFSPSTSSKSASSAPAARCWLTRIVCPHAGGPVCQGKIFNKVEEIITPDKKSAGLRFGKSRHIVCPWHGYEYDLATGCHPGDPSVRLTPVKVAVRDGQIYISLPE